ncbi:MAG TPA: amidohydrolase family protein [Candidatus Thermoplasmatota archaeon]|nr:amidohydrolase family protein [Candidatus Thermoplasmatota archaeon]
MATTFAGRILLRDRVVDGFVEVEGGRVVASGEGESPAKPTARGWIVPSPVNAHTHVGDAFLRDRKDKPANVKELVGPGGWKHRNLAAAAPDEVRAGIRRYAGEMAAVGTRGFLDFREGGLEGIRLLRGLAKELPIPAVAFGRPKAYGFEEREAEALLAEADGIGLSGVRDFKAADLEAWAEACHDADKPLALHASEDRGDDVEAVLALEPAFVIHMVQASDEELEELAQAKVPVAVAPRSNAFFGYRTPVDRMLAAGCTVAVGTDNGMLNDGNLLKDLAQLRAWHSRIPLEELLRMATFAPRAMLDEPAPGMPKPGQPADLVVLPEEPLPPVGQGKPSLGVRVA